MKVKIGILSIHGLPPRHGAFEQTVDQIIMQANQNKSNFKFYVGCEKKFREFDYQRKNVKRIFINKFKGPGVILFGLSTFIVLYIMGVRNFMVFGYALSPFFKLMEILGCSIICNVDGFEWRRSKWGTLAKSYFKFCEYCAGKSNAKLIFDSSVITRYYSIIHKKNGHEIFYGTENFNLKKVRQTKFKNKDYFVVVMRMEPENNIKTIVEAFHKSNSKKRLVIIGPSTSYFEKNVLKIINDSNKIDYLGPVYDREKLFDLRHGSLAYIHGHSVGGTNPTLVEACYVKRPIIAFDTLFNREVLGNYGYYFKNIYDLKDCIEKFDNINFKSRIPKKLSKNYEWDTISNQYLKLLNNN